MVEDKKKEEKQNAYELVEVPTQTAVVVRNTATQEIYNESQALALILNKLHLIEKAVC